MGFCYGGRASLSYGLHNNRIAATVIFYGSPVTDPQVLQSLSSPVLGIFGGADSSIPLADERAFEAGLKQAGIPNEITVYEGQPHAFVVDAAGIRAGGAQGEAWGQLLRFLDRSLKQGKSSGIVVEPSQYVAPFDWRYYSRLVYEHAFGTASGHGH
jgi:carboxymethylenebutenolidase